MDNANISSIYECTKYMLVKMLHTFNIQHNLNLPFIKSNFPSVNTNDFRAVAGLLITDEYIDFSKEFINSDSEYIYLHFPQGINSFSIVLSIEKKTNSITGRTIDSEFIASTMIESIDDKWLNKNITFIDFIEQFYELNICNFIFAS
jgi:hypothetical protein